MIVQRKVLNPQKQNPHLKGEGCGSRELSDSDWSFYRLDLGALQGWPLRILALLQR